MIYEHVVYYVEKDGKAYLAVDRLFQDGRRDFCTHFELQQVTDETAGFALMDKAADWLGNTLCIDNPSFRKHIKIQTESSK